MTDQDERKKTRVHLDQVKERHTTHWDLDVLPTEEVERLHRKGRRAHLRHNLQRLLLVLGIVLAVGCAVGLYLL